MLAEYQSHSEDKAYQRKHRLPFYAQDMSKSDVRYLDEIDRREERKVFDIINSEGVIRPY